jgi:Mg-chelatase subunit ChlD
MRHSPTLPRRLLHSRALGALVLGTQLLACLPGAALARGPIPGWPGPAPQPVAQPNPGHNGQAPAFGPVTTPPNFQAPSASHCARDIITTEVPGAPGRPAATERDSWPSAVGKAAAPRSAAPAPAPARSDSPAELADSAGRAEARTEAKAAATPHASAEVSSPSLRNRAPVSSEQVTAGVIDDNANFAEYLGFRQRTQVPHLERDVSERYLLQVRDAHGRSVPDAEVRVQAPRGQAMWARTDAGGQAWIAPNSFDASHAGTYQVSVRKPGRSGGFEQATGLLQRGQKSAVDITLDTAAPQRAQLDLVFLVDATGSMDDEIGKLKATLRTIATEVAQLPAQPDLCFALVAYRDKQDEFLLRSHDFTNNLNAFQGVLNQLQAGGGGDYPEAMSEALHHTVHDLSWRGNGTTRLVFLLADAPPHLDYGGPRYDEDMLAALGKGIKVFGVGASGLDKQGEYIQRQIAQYTGGKFVFLTYARAEQPSSGPGRETVHDVKDYSVDTLDRLIVRLVREDLAKLDRR